MSFTHNPRLPRKWGKDLAYFFGLLIGDGSLPDTRTKRFDGTYQKRYMIYFISNSEKFLKEVYIPLFKRLFSLNPRIEVRKRYNRNIIYNCRIESKKLYTFLVEKGYISGKKARVADVPVMPKKYHAYFLAGLLDTDGGKKGNGFGLSTASKHLAIFCEKMFKQLKFKYNSCPWNFNGHTYHQVYVPKSSMHKILKSIPIQNLDKIQYLKSSMPW